MIDVGDGVMLPVNVFFENLQVTAAIPEPGSLLLLPQRFVAHWGPQTLEHLVKALR